MEEELKYKIGDKVMIETTVVDVDNEDKDLPYRVNLGPGDLTWLSGKTFNKVGTVDKQKPKVTQDVMDFYKKHKDSNWSIRDYLRNLPEELENWFLFTKDEIKNQHAFATLIAYGVESVEVESEPLYIVVIPDSDSNNILQLWRSSFNKCHFSVENSAKCEKCYTFTEREIKDKDERLWYFAIPLGEVY